MTLTGVLPMKLFSAPHTPRPLAGGTRTIPGRFGGQSSPDMLTDTGTR